MCGIYCHLSRRHRYVVSTSMKELLARRGPDSLTELYFSINGIHLTIVASVLSLRGTHAVPQPLIDDATSSFLCWNGEAWQVDDLSVKGNDAKHIFAMLLLAAATANPSNLLKAFSRIRGPFATIFYDGHSQNLYYSRDCLGRRSLVQNKSPNGDLAIASIPDKSIPGTWLEVEADGMYVISLSDLAKSTKPDAFGVVHHPLTFSEPLPDDAPCLVCQAIRISSCKDAELSQQTLFPRLNHSLPSGDILPLTPSSPGVSEIHDLLLASLTLRLQNLSGLYSVPLAVLFSGGLDSALLAYYCHLILPIETPIDLLNVAFQNPRIHKSDLLDPYSSCPDRITGLRAYRELQNRCSGRQLRFITINIPYEETLRHRETIIQLMYPHKTEMDLSIASALYFASRGCGLNTSLDSGTSTSYTTNARVLISGLGADELFAGYSRHAVAFRRHGFQALIDELTLDFFRLGKRNLGRDDRITSHWGREVRYPFLDENVVNWAVKAPVWLKCGFGTMPAAAPAPDWPDLEPGKLILRLLAWRAGLHSISVEKKRAVGQSKCLKLKSD